MVFIVFIGFMVSIGQNMIAIIKLNYYSNKYSDEALRKKSLRDKIKKVVVLFILLIVIMFLSFFLNYLFSKR